jgi:uncharacterized protein YaaQ
MKLLLAIVHNDDAHDAMEALVAAGHRVTRLASAGGLLGQGNTTLLCGLDEEQVVAVIALISQVCQARTVDLQRGHPLFSNIRQVRLGGAVGFVVDVERFFRL